jgi:aminopeptidase
VLVNFALGTGKGISAGDVVQVAGPESAKPLYAEVCRAVWRAGGHVIHDFRPDNDPASNLNRDFLEMAGDEQLEFVPKAYWRGLIDQCDHGVHLFCEADPHALRDVDPSKIMRRQESFMPVIEWQQHKESEGHYTWTIGLYGTEAMAAEAGLSSEEYWEQIISACYLDDDDPVTRWREVTAEVDRQAAFMTSLPIDRLHVEGQDADLWFTLGERRRWSSGEGRNIPSFEVYTCPDWRGTEGWIRFSEPLYTHGSLIKGIRLEFREGLVVAAAAEQNEHLLKEMIAADGADRVGEYSLTDAGVSRINRFMANTLYDENMGGPYGNTHLAVGLGVRSCYDGDEGAVTEEEWERLGFNKSAIHTDIVSTSDRTVTAIMRDGSERVVYAGGHFQT